MNDLLIRPKPKLAIRTDRLLKALTNSPGPFFNGTVPTDVDFYPVRQSKEWYALRSGLMLDADSDYFLALAVTILDSYDDIKSLLPNNHVSFGKEILLQYRSEMQGGGFFTAGERVGQILDYPDYFPIPTRYVIKCKDSETLVISSDLGREFNVSYKVFPDSPGSLLAVDWPIRTPFRGPIRTDLPWTPGSELHVHYSPRRVDFEKWLEFIVAKVQPAAVLGPTGLLTAYTIATEPTERLALLVATLALLNTSMDHNE